MKHIKYTQIIASSGIIALMGGILLLGTEYQLVEILRVVVGSVFLLFLPGRWMTKIFFDAQEIDMLERIALSFALSISVIPLLVFYFNLAGLKISAFMVWLVATAVIMICMTISLYRAERVQKSS